MLSNQEKLLEFQKSIDRQLKGQIEKIDSEVTQYKDCLLYTSRSRSSRDEPYEDPNGFSDEEWDFWLKVAGEIEAAGEGGRVTASAERYERLPFPVLHALHARRDVTLRLERQGESVLLDYTLPAGRVFYPLEELMEHGGA